MMKHTKGEWRVRYFNPKGDDGECEFFVQAPRSKKSVPHDIEIMGDDYGEHIGYPREQRLADAKLIAAAPDLLEAILFAKSVMEKEGIIETSERLAIERIDAAIKKAVT